MPRIEQIVSGDTRLPPFEKQVLDVMEKHPDYLFRRDKKADLQELRAWLLAPHHPEPPKALMDTKVVQPISILEHTIASLHHKGVIGCISINSHNCYGSHEAIRRARAALEAQGMEAREVPPREDRGLTGEQDEDEDVGVAV